MIAGPDFNSILNNTHQNNAARQIYLLNEALRPQKIWMAEPLHRGQGFCEKAYDVYKDQWGQAFPEYPDNEIRKDEFLKSLLEDNSPRKKNIPTILLPLYETLHTQWKQAFEENKQRQLKVLESVKPVIGNLRSHVRDFQINVKNLSLRPNQVLDPHPNNVRFVAPTSQNYATPGPHGMDNPNDLSIANKNWVRAISATQSLDDAIGLYEQSFIIPAEADPKLPDATFSIVSPVSTPTSNPTAWRKTDNTNPYVRRIAVFIDDGVENMRSQTKGIMSYFVKGSPNQWQAQQPGYRVDEVMVVNPPTAQEMQQGVTIHHKLQQAFASMQGFVNQQKFMAAQQGIDPNQLKFESYVSWQVHGSANLPAHLKAKEAQQNAPCDERFQEGSMDFKMLFQPGFPDSNHNVSKPEIKQLERAYLKDFHYVVQHSISCTSGAMIA